MKNPIAASTPLVALPPLLGENARILILGSMPGVASLEANEYYAHPRNAFWKILSSVFEHGIDSWPSKVSLIKSHQLALWDVLKECQRPGSLDSSIRKDSIVCNDFAAFLHRNASIERIVFNGKTAEQLFLKHVVPTLNANSRYEMIAMPSTSPAMASLGLVEKTDIWRRSLVFETR